jgi:hypothetical protein
VTFRSMPRSIGARRRRTTSFGAGRASATCVDIHTQLSGRRGVDTCLLAPPRRSPKASLRSELTGLVCVENRRNTRCLYTSPGGNLSSTGYNRTIGWYGGLKRLSGAGFGKMSNETKEHADNARRDLQSAEKSLQSAGDHAKKAGDAGITKQIEKARIDTAKVRRELDRRLDPNRS